MVNVYSHWGTRWPTLTIAARVTCCLWSCYTDGPTNAMKGVLNQRQRHADQQLGNAVSLKA